MQCLGQSHGWTISMSMTCRHRIKPSASAVWVAVSVSYSKSVTVNFDIVSDIKATRNNFWGGYYSLTIAGPAAVNPNPLTLNPVLLKLWRTSNTKDWLIWVSLTEWAPSPRLVRPSTVVMPTSKAVMVSSGLNFSICGPPLVRLSLNFFFHNILPDIWEYALCNIWHFLFQ